MTDNQNQTSKAKRFWLVVIGLVGFVLSNFSTAFIFLKTRPSYAMAVSEGVLRASGSILLAATMAISISETLHQQNEAKVSKKRIAAASGLVLVAVVLAFMSFRASSEFKKFDKYMQGLDFETKEKIEKKLQTSESMEKKSKLSHLYAQVTFEEEGKIIEYLRPDGKAVAYVPSPESINNRDMVLFLKTHRKVSPPTDIFIGIVWLASLIAAIGLSIRGRTRGRRTPNH
jgi:hypothetical protein